MLGFWQSKPDIVSHLLDVVVISGECGDMTTSLTAEMCPALAREGALIDK